MNKVLKSTLGWLIIIIPLVFAIGFIFNSLSKKSFYPDEGNINIMGITSPVKVYTDDYGMNHILASNEDDVFFTMGFVHAQNRLWQMDLTRRVAEGRLAEIFGSGLIDFDKLFRTIGVDKFAYRWINNVSPKTKQILTAYSNGVNKFIEIHNENLPVEFDALNYRPEIWKPEHSLMLARLMAWDLNISWYTDYVFGEIVNKVGLEKASEIFPDTTFSIYTKPKVNIDSLLTDSTDDISQYKIESEFKLTSELGKDYFDVNESYRKFFGINCSHTGSNSWVVSGDKSESGKPLLANDPHLGFQAPSKWYEVHIKSNSIDVTGMSIPGVPGIVIGHNKNISWGLTNLMNDDNDFIILNRDSSDLSKYRYQNQSYAFDSTTERISVKDSMEVIFTIQNTKIGPVISNLRKRSFTDAKTDNTELKFYGDKILTFKWTGYDYSDEVLCFYKLNTSNNWEDFKNGLKDFNVPAMNFTYADVNGNIGYHAGGKIPIRKTSDDNNIIIPSTEEIEWSGYVDFDNLPNMYNPKEGYIITANTNPFEWLKTEPKDRYYISCIWEPSSRYNRINELLKDRSRFNLNDFRLIQMDYQSLYAKELTKHIISAFKNYTVDDQNVSKALELLKDWNGEMRSNEAYGSIYNCFLVALINNIFLDELGENVFRDYLIVQNLAYRAIELLLKQENSDWFDNINTSAKETKEQIIQKSLFDAIEVLKQEFPNKEIYNWQWGELHKVKFRHPLGWIPALDNAFNIGPFEVGGDQTTINNAEYSFNSVLNEVNFSNNLGPTMRFLIDMSDVSRALTVNTTGQSGQPLHPNYSDQSRMWQYGDYKQGIFEEYQIKGSNLKVLTLTPSN